MGTIPETLALARRHQRMGELAEAARLCREVLRADPAHVDALYLYGTACQGLGRVRDAAAACEQVLRFRPQHPGAFNNLGVALASQGRWAEAVDCYGRALALRPDFAEACNNLGIALAELGRVDEAVLSWRRALRLRPDLADAHNNLGIACKTQGKLDEAVACYERALELRPDLADAHLNLGNVFQAKGKPDEALACYRRALRQRPGHAEAHLNMGNVLHAMGKLDEAEASYGRAIAADPGHALAHTNLGMTLLLRGRFVEGWAEYEWRRRTPGFPEVPFRQPCWDGSPPSGRTILLYAEQGIGDAIQFVRYARALERRGARVIVACTPPLLRLLRGASGVVDAVPIGPADTLPPFGAHAPLLSLPRLLGTTLADIPAEVPYLAVDPRLVGRWRRELGNAGPGLRVGIAWQGNPRHLDDRARSIPLDRFAPLAAVPGVRLVSLQRGPGSEQLGAPAGSFPVSDLGAALDAAGGDVLDTAAAMSALDLVIACDTAVAHLAGALALPVWVALHTVPDWRWLLDRDDSPWYPTARLFRQHMPGDWASVFGRIAAALASLSLSSWFAVRKGGGGPIDKVHRDDTSLE